MGRKVRRGGISWRIKVDMDQRGQRTTDDNQQPCRNETANKSENPLEIALGSDDQPRESVDYRDRRT